MGLKRIAESAGRNESSKPLSRILYVEDEEANWQVTELHLRGKYELQRAKNSDEALRLLRREKFDLVLLDIQLSGSKLDGIQICEELRRSARSTPPRTMARPDTPIVFVTAYSARYDKPSLMAAGADDVITKPVDYTRLLLVSSRLILRNVQKGAAAAAS